MGELNQTPDEEQISVEWDAIAAAQTEASVDVENDAEETGSSDKGAGLDLFAGLMRKPKSSPLEPPSNGGRRDNMEAALSIVRAATAARTPVPPPPSRRQLAKQAQPTTPPPSVASPPPPPSSRVASTAPPPPSARKASAPDMTPTPVEVDIPPNAPEAGAPVEDALVEEPGSQDLTQKISDATPLTPPPLAAFEAPQETAGDDDGDEDENADLWADQTPTTHWTAKKRLPMPKARSEAPAFPKPPALPRLPSAVETVPRSRVLTQPTLRPSYAPATSIPPMALSQPPAPFARHRDVRTALLAVAAALAVGLLALVVLLVPRGAVFASGGAGSLIVTAAGPNNSPVDAVQVFVDGAIRCNSAPCRVDDLDARSHFVRVAAAGYAPSADRAVAVRAGQDTVLHVPLFEKESARHESAVEPEPAAAPAPERTIEPAPAVPTAPATKRSALEHAKPAFVKPKPAKATLSISSMPPSNVIVDGRPLGMTPKTVRVRPGTHTVVFAGPKGRKVRSVKVGPGASRGVAVTF